MKEENHTSAFIGLGCSVLALALFGKDSFLIPAMVSIVVLIALFRSSIEKSILMTALPLWQQAVLILLCAAATMTILFLPFILLRPDRELPSAIFALLVIYCLKDVSLRETPHGIPEFLSLLLTGFLHIRKRQMMLSMAGGTVPYMVLLQLVFSLQSLHEKTGTDRIRLSPFFTHFSLNGCAPSRYTGPPQAAERLLPQKPVPVCRKPLPGLRPEAVPDSCLHS